MTSIARSIIDWNSNSASRPLTISEFIERFKDRPFHTNGYCISNHRLILVYDGIINSYVFSYIIPSIYNIRVTYDELRTYVAVEFALPYECKAQDLCIPYNENTIRPRMKTIYKSDWPTIVMFFDEWNSWNSIDIVKLDIDV